MKKSNSVFKKKQPIEILGEMIGPDNQPVLYEWAKRNKPELERQLKSIAEKWHQGSVRAAVLTLESDLEHG